MTFKKSLVCALQPNRLIFLQLPQFIEPFEYWSADCSGAQAGREVSAGIERRQLPGGGIPVCDRVGNEPGGFDVLPGGPCPSRF